MRVFIYLLSLLLGLLSSAVANQSLYERFKSPPASTVPALLKIDWSKPENKMAQKYKAAFEMKLAQVKSGEGHLLGQRFVVINPGCGSECQVIGYFDTLTGNAYLTQLSSSYGLEYHANSSLLIINPADKITETYGADVPDWLKTRYYHINDNAELNEVTP